MTPIFSKHRLSSKSIAETPRKSVRGYLWIELSQEFRPLFVLTLLLLAFDQIQTGKGKALFVGAKDQKNWKKMKFTCFAFKIGIFPSLQRSWILNSLAWHLFVRGQVGENVSLRKMPEAGNTGFLPTAMRLIHAYPSSTQIGRSKHVAPSPFACFWLRQGHVTQF